MAQTRGSLISREDDFPPAAHSITTINIDGALSPH